MNRVTVYIDGLNFDYALKRMTAKDRDWQKFFWIDFVTLFKHFAPHQTVEKVVYFTTTPIKEHLKTRQSALLKANRLLNGRRFEVILGKYYEKEYICPQCEYKYTIPEEKRTDVNISAQMMLDCAMNNTDVLFLVSADSDLIPPLKIIKKHYPDKDITVLFPPGNFSYDIRNFVKSNSYHLVRLENNERKLTASIMPDIVTVNGKTSTIPPEWKV
jgi:uncharacterized LabA/DUF88 family protein